MSYELDMSQYLDLFLQEAGEQLEVLEQETLKLEVEPSEARLQAIFRAAHTLKGSARAMGFQAFAELTHEMENILDNLRNGTLAVTTEIMDAILACADTLNQMVASIGAGNGDAIECQVLVANLQKFLDGSQAPSAAVSPSAADPAAPECKLTEYQKNALNTAAEAGQVWRAHFTLADDCAMKYVRAYMAINAVAKFGEMVATSPEAEALEDEHFEFDFDLFYVLTKPDSAAELQAGFDEISEVAALTVSEWTPSQVQSEPDNVVQLVQASASESAPASAPATPAPTATPAKTASDKKAVDSGQTVRVDVARLDSLMNLVGELVIDRTRIVQISTELAARYNDDNIEALCETTNHVHRITSDLQDQIMKARMMPIEATFNRLPRIIRDLAQKLEKDIRLEVSGGETELDRSVIEVIGDPLIHILRNSVDHGIELPADRVAAGKPAQGTIWLSARHQENHIVVEIRDDGRGIDVERVKAKAVANGLLTQEAADRMSDKDACQLIFNNGLSTAKVVSEVSGRGVGMDIVKSNIQKLGGLIEVDSDFGKETRISLRIPLTLAIIRGLLVKVGGIAYVVPLGNVIETIALNRSDVQTVGGKEVIVLRGLTTPLVNMQEAFKISKDTPDGGAVDQHYVVIVGIAEHRLGLIVDGLIGEREVVIKSLSRICETTAGLSGATILGDGSVALIVDVNALASQNYEAQV